MSATHRSLIRLPNDIFTNLIHRQVDPSSSPLSAQQLKSAICTKLQEFNGGNSNGRGNGYSNGSGGNLLGGGGKNHHSGVSAAGVTTVGQLMRISSITLLRILDPLLTYDECQELVYRISKQCSSKPKTAREMFNTQQTNINDSTSTSTSTNSITSTTTSSQIPPISSKLIPTGLSKLDTILRGGIRFNSITEIVGCAGIGKTQLVMQIAIIAAAMEMGCIYIDTERKLSLKRMHEIAHERYEHYVNHHQQQHSSDYYSTSQRTDESGNDSGGDNDKDENDQHQQIPFKPPLQVLNNITIHTPNSTAELSAIISKLQEEIILRNLDQMESSYTYPVKLIILDSIAAPTRRDFGGEDARERVNAIFRIAQMLKQVADEMNVAVLVINQITEQIVTTTTTTTTTMSNGKGRDYNKYLSTVKASLGMSWYHCVTTRIQLEQHDFVKEGKGYDDDNDVVVNDLVGGREGNDKMVVVRPCLRKASVVKSNLVGQDSANFEITMMGVCQV